ncbi:kinase-like protein [Annulohypoxylon truncatum]|uniref:kinase-like protein n=1 Tax=Annulohypoxylon truncatum TaxID=327061 RepID=UPI0020089E3F|nr:kinase-like protein [Annulohypoxylon truncatum]KAI1212785.1 kinase-like protein [Annulohypoxylon truncatum]
MSAPTSNQLLHPHPSTSDAEATTIKTNSTSVDAATATATPATLVTRISSSASTKSANSAKSTKSSKSTKSAKSTKRSPGIFNLERPPFDFAINLIIHPTDLSPSPSTSSLNTTNTTATSSTSSQTPIDSLRRYPAELTNPIPEEGDEETSSESYSNEPITPVSGRQSRDFRYCEQNDTYHRDSITNYSVASSSGVAEHADDSLNTVNLNKDAVNPALSFPSPNHLVVPAQHLIPPSHAPPPPPTTLTSQPTSDEPLNTPPSPQTESYRPKSARRPSSSRRKLGSRRSSSALSTISVFSRKMSIFKRNSYHVGDRGATADFRDPNYESGSSESNLTPSVRVTPNTSRRRFSMQRSTRSNTPPSPASPVDTPPNSRDNLNRISIPTSKDFLENRSKKGRANTGLSIREKVVNFTSTKYPRRTRSVERKKKNEEELTRQPWAIPPDAGTGMKARRLSLSLPDDFTVDVAELMKEYEYQHKFLGRHGKHLGKGATSKVTLMARRGSPGELYAVKEFRSKSSSETVEEYEKKIKSEYSIAKSLHHPNIVETIRLCTNHGRWNHVMEYCSEGDLFTLVSKRYLKEEGRDVDRLCIFKQLCQGINYLHSNGIAHRDIKLENLLITKDSKVKITDFGVSEVFSGIHPGLREAGGQCGIGMGEVRLCKPGICGSLPYIAPEVLSKKVEYDPRPLDVWSSAIVMLYLIFNANLWEKAQFGGSKTYNELASGWEKIDAKRATDPESVKDAYPKVQAFECFVKPVALRRILLNMLHPDPQKRMTMNEVVTNRWIKNIECCQLESYEDPVKFIDASKKDCMKSSTGKIFCHNHLPPLSTGHGLPPMPGKPGY